MILILTGKVPLARQERLKSLEVAPDAGFIVAGAAGEYLALAYDAVEGFCIPERQRIDTGCTS